MGLRRWERGARARCEAALDARAPAPAHHARPRARVPRRGARRGGAPARVRSSCRDRRGRRARAYLHLGELLRLRGDHAGALAGDGRRRARRRAARHARLVRPLHVRQRGRRPAAARALGRGRGSGSRAAARMDLAHRGAPCGTRAPAQLHALRGELGRGARRARRALADDGLPSEFVAPLGAARATLALAEGDPAAARRTSRARSAAATDPLYTPPLYSLGAARRGRARGARRAPRRRDVATGARAEALLAELDALARAARGAAGRARPPGARPRRARPRRRRPRAERWAPPRARWTRSASRIPAAYARLRAAEATLLAGGERAPRGRALAAAARRRRRARRRAAARGREALARARAARRSWSHRAVATPRDDGGRADRARGRGAAAARRRA